MIRLQSLLTLLSVVFCGFYMKTEAARAPKIYNALITSDENLSPSQAFPIIEPVLRTTTFGVAPYAPPFFQPLIVRPQSHQFQLQDQQKINQNQNQQLQHQIIENKSAATQHTPPLQNQPMQHNQQIQQNQPQQFSYNYHDSYPLYPVSYDPYLQYGYHRDYVYSPPLPYYQQPVYIDYGQPQNVQNIEIEQKQPQPQPQTQNTEIEKEQEQRPVPVLPPQVHNEHLQPAPSHVNFKKNPEIPDVIPPLPFTLRRENKQQQKRSFSSSFP